MPQRNRPSPHIHLPHIQPQLLHAIHRHGRECFVEFDDVNVRQGEVVLVQEFGDGEGRADAHDAGGETRDGGADVFGEDGLVAA